MSDSLNYRFLATPIGHLRLVSNGRALVRIEFQNRHGDDGRERGDPVLEQAARELQEYFAGERQTFRVPLEAEGSAFQQAVWSALKKIPYGALRSYRDIAEQLGNRRAVRAVGAANGRNPIPIIVPCHRVVGSDGKLTGFAGGLPTKRALLDLEGVRGNWSEES
jgi:methylated-DNA-[protein]-cysteine S-methyltransferase